MRVRAKGAAASRGAGVVSLVLAGVAACGGGGGDTYTQPAKPRAAAGMSKVAQPPGRSGHPARMLSQRELERSALGAGDAPGWRVGRTKGDEGDSGKPGGPTYFPVSARPRVTPSACQPLADMVNTLSAYQHHSVVELLLTPSSGAGITSFAMTLRSYSPTDAPKVLADLRTSLRTCSSFSTSALGVTLADPEPQPDPHLGDDALAYRIVQNTPGVGGGPVVEAPLNFVVFRSGATVAVSYTLSLPGLPEQPVPLDAVRAQTAKLDRAT